jgi:hypothetical protein
MINTAWNLYLKFSIIESQAILPNSRNSMKVYSRQSSKNVMNFATVSVTFEKEKRMCAFRPLSNMKSASSSSQKSVAIKYNTGWTKVNVPLIRGRDNPVSV